MNAVVQTAFAALLALVTRETAAPVAPFGYGADTSCGDDLDEAATDLDGFDRRVLAQATVRRLTTPRGTLPDDPNYGIDIRDALNRGLTTEEIRLLGGQIQGELTKDDRLEAVSVVVKPTPTGDRLRIEIAIRPRDPRFGGPFSLTLALTSAALLIEEMGR